MATTQEEIAEYEADASRTGQGLRQRFSNYDSWTASDFNQLRAVDVSALRRLIGFNEHNADWGAVIPRSFTEQYGDAGYALFLVSLHRRADELNIESGFAADLLRSTFGTQAGLTPIEISILRTNNQVDVPFAPGVRATPPEIINYQMADYFFVRNQDTFTLSETASQAFVRENPIIGRRAPQVVENVEGEVGVQVTFPLAAAYDSGYASGTTPGLSHQLGNLQIGFSPEEAAAAMPEIARRTATPTTDDDFIINRDGVRVPITVRLAWTAGNIQAQMDDANPANDNNTLYGVNIAQVATGGRGAGGGF